MIDANIIRPFQANWTGTGIIYGSGDLERIELNPGEYMESEDWELGAMTAIINLNKYLSGDTVIIYWKTASTQAGLVLSAWQPWYGGSFVSEGWIKLRIEF